ncbi:predicted protein [Uncinocarpus reesii 1704]|uniref:Uncharacterized protein n=1 Tax=Uncinocarpus reesii (strain UAMH 1704) TaxID=336963 RepID=C4JIN0_UNCRE|nr:uncharacterized protein UREG_02891 [Uncinocarpus reesii 1704]EEP78042.1 predicted protein [Uncinocarpus reesii 1704]
MSYNNTGGLNPLSNDPTQGGQYGNLPTATGGPHSSVTGNKLDPTVDSTTGARTGMAGHTGGPHSSNMGNKLDPRVDSDTGRTTHATGAPPAAPYGGTGATTGYGVGPHSSSLGNKIDPRVDSDTGRTTHATGGNTGHHTSGLANKLDPTSGSNTGYSHTAGHTAHHGTTGSAFGATGGTVGHGTTGPHGSSLGNKLDPRVDSDTGRTTHATGGNHGPHGSGMANKVDPTIDSTTGAHRTTGTTGAAGTTGTTGTTAGTSAGKSGGAGGALKSVAAGIHGMGEKIRGATGAAIDKATNDHEGLRKNENIKRQGEQEMHSGQFSKDTKAREGLHHSAGGNI